MLGWAKGSLYSSNAKFCSALDLKGWELNI